MITHLSASTGTYKRRPNEGRHGTGKTRRESPEKIRERGVTMQMERRRKRDEEATLKCVRMRSDGDWSPLGRSSRSSGFAAKRGSLPPASTAGMFVLSPNCSVLSPPIVPPPLLAFHAPLRSSPLSSVLRRLLRVRATSLSSFLRSPSFCSSPTTRERAASLPAHRKTRVFRISRPFRFVQLVCVPLYGPSYRSRQILFIRLTFGRRTRRLFDGPLFERDQLPTIYMYTRRRGSVSSQQSRTRPRRDLAQ